MSKPKAKQLDDESLEIMRAGFNQRAKQIDILSKLIALGYVKKRGGALDQTEMSRIMLKNGMKYGLGNRRKNKKELSPITDMELTVPKKSVKAKVLEQIAEIAMSNLSDEIKFDVIINYVRPLLEVTCE